MKTERRGPPVASAEDDAARSPRRPSETDEERQRVIRPWVEHGTPEQQHASAIKTVSMLGELRTLRTQTDLSEKDKLRLEKLTGSEPNLRKNLEDLGVTLTETDAGFVAQRNGARLEIPAATEGRSAERVGNGEERQQRRTRTPEDLATDLIRRNDELVRLRALPNPSDTDTKRISSLERSVAILKRQVAANVPPETPSTDAAPKPTEEQAPKAGKNKKNGAVTQQGGKFDVGDIDNAYDAGLAKARADYWRSHPQPTSTPEPEANAAATEPTLPTGEQPAPENAPVATPDTAVEPIPVPGATREPVSEKVPTPEPPPQPPRKIEVGIVNIEQKIEEVAKFRAEQRLQAELRGEHDKKYYRSERWWVRGLDTMLDAIPTVRKAVRQMGEKGYRERYIALERKRIIENLRAANPAAAAKGEVALTSPETRAIIDRFLTDAQGVIETQKGEKKESAAEREVQDAVRTMMDEYVQGNLTREQFQDKRDALVELLQTSHGTVLDADKTKTIDNLLDVAEELRAAVAHGEKISVMDFEIDVKLGRARSAIEDEANLRAYDKLVQKIQKTPVLNKFVSPATLGFVTSITTNVLLSKFTRMGLMAAGATSLGAGTAVAGAFAGLRRGMEVKRDSSYVRRGHAVGLEVPAGAKKLEKMSEFVYEQASVADLTKDISGALTAMQQEADPAQIGGRIDALIAQIAEADARQDMGYQLHHDLLRYSDPQKIEQERLEFLKTSARAKDALQQFVAAHKGEVGIPADLDQAVQQARSTKGQAIRSSMEDVDKKFRHFRNVEVAKAVGYGAVTGLVAGAVFQEAAAHIFHPHGTHADTAIDHLAKKIFGMHDHLGPDHSQVVDGAKWNLPPGVHAEHVPGHPDMMSLVDDRGRTLHEALPVNPDGSLTNAAQHDLIRDGWMAHGSTVEGTGTVPAEEWVKHHPGLTFIDRRDWMDQNTPHLPDLNELKLWWGGLHGTGVDAQGNFLFNIGKMTEHGSFHGGITENVKHLLHSGDLRMHCAISQGTQKFVFEFPIDEKGNAMIPKDSEAAKMLFRVQDGHAKYLGRFAEAVRVFHNKDGSLMKGPDGGIVSRMFATHEGAGLDQIAGVPQKVVDLLQPKPWELPPTIPLSQRKAMEEWGLPVEPAYGYDRDQPPSNIIAGYDYEQDQAHAALEPGYDYENGQEPYDSPLSSGYESEDGKPYDLSQPERKPSPESVDHAVQSMRHYIEQSGDRTLLNQLDAQIGKPMSERTRMSVVMPCYRESANIYRSLEGWTTKQKDLNPDEVEFTLFVNTPNNKEAPDRKTIDEILRFKANHPEYAIHLVTHQFAFPDKVIMGSVYKTATDLAVLRNLARLDRGVSQEVVGSHLLYSGGADAVGRNPNFLRTTIDFLRDHPDVEQIRGQAAYPKEVRERFPLLNAVTSIAHSLSVHPMFDIHTSNVGMGTYRARIYAEAGGFDPRHSIREEIALNKAIQRAVGGRERKAVRKILVKNAIDNPRRSLFAFIKGLGIRNAYRSFGDPKLEQELREFDWEALVKERRLPRAVGRVTALTADNASREFDIMFAQYQRYSIPRADLFRRICEGEEVTNVAASHPEQRLLLGEPEVQKAISVIRSQQQAGKVISATSPEAVALAAAMTQHLFDRTFRISLGLHEGRDYVYKHDGTGVHLQITKEGAKHLLAMSKKKWEHFGGYWKED